MESQTPSDNLHIKNLEVGSFFKLGEDFYEVKAISKYIEDEEWEWYELSVYSITEDKIVYLEWEEDDEIELFLSIECKIPVTEVFSSFDAMVTATKVRDPIKFRGKKFRFDEKCKALFFKEGSPRGQSVKMFDFTCGDDGLSIEKWGKGEDDYEISLGRVVDYGTLEVVAI